MLYYLFEYINTRFDPPGFDVFRFITFRAAAAAITALLISWIVGPRIIRLLKRKQIGEAAKLEAPQTHLVKAGTPTMGGLIVLASSIIPVLLWGQILNTYVWLVLFATLGLGIVGFIDDYLKVVKKYPKGLIGEYKIVGQVIVGVVVGVVLYVWPHIESHRSITTVPFLKDALFDFGVFYIPMIVIVITATSNSVNLTDGLDGLAIGTISIAFLSIALMCYVSGNVKFAQYLSIIYLPGSGELTVFSAAIIGAGLGFLWFNAYPAQVFMGDVGALALGAALGVVAVSVHQELVLFVMGGVFVMETLSVIMQVASFKLTGKRIFRMAPLHHHFELKGWPEPRVIVRFWIVTVILVLIGLASLKIR